MIGAPGDPKAGDWHGAVTAAVTAGRVTWASGVSSSMAARSASVPKAVGESVAARHAANEKAHPYRQKSSGIRMRLQLSLRLCDPQT